MADSPMRPFEDVGLGPRFQVGGADDRRRGRCVKARGLQTSRGDDDLFDAFLGHRSTGAERQNCRAARETCAVLRKTVIHVSPLYRIVFFY